MTILVQFYQTQGCCAVDGHSAKTVAGAICPKSRFLSWKPLRLAPAHFFCGDTAFAGGTGYGADVGPEEPSRQATGSTPAIKKNATAFSKFILTRLASLIFDRQPIRKFSREILVFSAGQMTHNAPFDLLKYSRLGVSALKNLTAVRENGSLTTLWQLLGKQI